MATYLLDANELPPASFGKCSVFLVLKLCGKHVEYTFTLYCALILCVCAVLCLCILCKELLFVEMAMLSLAIFIRCYNARSVWKIENLCVALHWIGNKRFIANECDLILTPFLISLPLCLSISHFSSLFTMSFSSVLTGPVLNTSSFHRMCSVHHRPLCFSIQCRIHGKNVSRRFALFYFFSNTNGGSIVIVRTQTPMQCAKQLIRAW